eukprot:3206231-Rhodomonas_salina.1
MTSSTGEELHAAQWAPNVVPRGLFSVCAFLTDVEGNWDYFQRYVALSEVLSWTDLDRRRLLLKDDCEFCFGGDAQDKGIGDIRIMQLLLDLKERYPQR